VADVIGPPGQSVEVGGNRIIKAQLALVREQKDGRRRQLVGHLSDVEHRFGVSIAPDSRSATP
jgi:hypothetical protein